ncbi:MAG: tRNA (cytidine(56)-2'-O)-methyltransferase [Candidatus Micrarchaeota archaeon]|nr:tRNA (cytidine(56)-2'-O)-methyltransferase [Candidatus Micrarchaeota archaeon]
MGKSTYASSLDLCLTSRALGASEITFVGIADRKILGYVSKLNKNWGGRFRVNFAKSHRELLAPSSKYIKVYLTRYGVPLHEKKYSLKTYRNILLIVTLKDNDKAKQVHKLADFNISVSSQPHCSSAAIAIFLHEFYNGRELAMHFENAKYKVIPKEHDVEVKEVSSR